MRFKDLSLKSKQISAIGLVLVLVAGSNLFALRQLQLMKDDIDEVSGFWLNRAETLGRLAINVALVRLGQVQMAATSDHERRLEYARVSIERLDSVATYWDRFSAIRLDSLDRELHLEEQSWSIQEQATYEALEDSWDMYLGELLFFLDPDEALDEETRERIFDESEDDFVEVAALLGDLITINEEAWVVSEERAATNFRNARTVTRTLVIGAILLSILITTVLVRFISKPVTELTRAAEQVAAGDRSVQIDADSKDEIGRLSASFNRMTVALREQEEELLRRQAETEDKNRELEAALDQLRRTQQQLVVREKMASLGQLTAGIAHEIKNPLNFVNNFARLTRELAEELREELEGNISKPVEEVLPQIEDLLADINFNADRIGEHGSRADSIVKNMLLHSRGAPGETASVDVNKLVDEYVQLSYHGMRASDKTFNATILTDFDPNVGEITVVPQNIGRAFLNILNNAFYAVFQQSREEDGAFEPEVRISTSRTDGRVTIEISDNGPGIPRDHIQRIFEPFFTTKPTGSGTGLGLSLAYDIVTKEHEGNLSVESEVGKGTTFVITLTAS